MVGVTVGMVVQMMARSVQGGAFFCTELLLWADWCREVASPVQIQWVFVVNGFLLGACEVPILVCK